MADFRTALEVLLKAKDETRQATSSAGTNFSNLAGKITALSTGFLAVRQAAQDAIGVVDTLVGDVVRDAASFDAFSRRIGISAEALSELKFAGEVANVEFNQLSIGIQRLTRRIGEIARLGTGEAKPAIEALGLSIEDLIDLRAEDQFETILEALGGVANASERAALAMKFFDSEGVALVQLAGRTKDLRDRARELGISMDEDFINRAVEARERGLELTATMKGLRNELVNEFLLRFDDEALQKAVDLAETLTDIASRAIPAVIDLTVQATDFGRFLFHLWNAPLGQAMSFAEFRLMLRTEEAEQEVEDLKNEIAAKLGELSREDFLTQTVDLQINSDDPAILEDVLRRLDAIIERSKDAEGFEKQTEAAEALRGTVAGIVTEQGLNEDALIAAIKSANELGTGYEEILRTLGEHRQELEGSTMAAALLREHWSDISAAAEAQFLTQTSIQNQLQEMVASGMTLGQAWQVILDRLGITDERLRGIVGEIQRAENPMTSITERFDLFNSSAIDMAEALKSSLEFQSAHLGENVTAMIGNTLERMNYLWTTALVQGESFADGIRKLFKQLVADILAELAKLYAKRLGLALLGSLIPGIGPLLGTGAGAALTGLSGNTLARQLRPPGLGQEPEIDVNQAAPIMPEPIEVDVPAPEVMMPTVEVREPDPIMLDPITVDVPAPEVLMPDIDVRAPDPVILEPVRVDIPAPEVPMPEVIIQQAPIMPRPPTVIEAPPSPLTREPQTAKGETRNMTFNISINTGFSTRGVGLETARVLVPFLREVGAF